MVTVTEGGCQRCGRPTIRDRDSYGEYAHCVICGVYQDTSVHAAADTRRSQAYEPNGTGDVTPDVGCKAAPSCLNCPFPVCIHDNHRVFYQTRRREIWAGWMIEIKQKLSEGIPNEVVMLQVAEANGVTDRTVYRAVKLLREGH
jgi:hypothetical protein